MMAWPMAASTKARRREYATQGGRYRREGLSDARGATLREETSCPPSERSHCVLHTLMDVEEAR